MKNRFELKPFQVDTVKALSETFIDLWKTNKYKIPFVFKSPTGSGKTIMMAEFLLSINDNYQFDEDKCYIWISFGDDTSYKQSMKKISDYFGEEFNSKFKDKSDLTEGSLGKNDMLFINWSSLKASNKDGRVLRAETEKTSDNKGIFDDFIINTKRERDIILIVDEAHTETDTALADEIIELINPRLIMKVTATPKELPSITDIRRQNAGFVEVYEEDVIESGLIKERLMIQTQEDIEKLQGEKEELSIDQLLLYLGINKRKELKKIFDDNNIKVNPLVMIQLPNDYKEDDEVAISYKDMILQELKNNGVKDDEIAIWLSGEKDTDKLENITNNNDEVNYLIFKVAPATGWDCPRASILIMYREIQSPTFRTQILGRIKRMPFGEHFKDLPELNRGYIFTNYDKNSIKIAAQSQATNTIPIYYSRKKDDVTRIELEGIRKTRTGYNTITPPTTWQKYFFSEMDIYFNIDKNNHGDTIQKIGTKIDIKNIVKNSILVNAEIDSFDNFIQELKERSEDVEYDLSQYNIEKLYNLLCFNVLKEQNDEQAKYNVARSWRTLRSSINSWFQSRTDLRSPDEYYGIIVNDMLKKNSSLKEVIYKSLIKFREVVGNKTEYELQPNKVSVPEYERSYSTDYELIPDISKYAMDKLYLKKEYLGRLNETEFINYLESIEEIDWWYKQADSGQGVFGCLYMDSDQNREDVFNPDFIIKTKSKLYILDTKSGMTLKENKTAFKCRGLQEWIRQNKDNFNFDIIGGIVTKKGHNWMINSSRTYDHKLDHQWNKLEF